MAHANFFGFLIHHRREIIRRTGNFNRQRNGGIVARAQEHAVEERLDRHRLPGLKAHQRAGNRNFSAHGYLICKLQVFQHNNCRKQLGRAGRGNLHIRIFFI